MSILTQGNTVIQGSAVLGPQQTPLLDTYTGAAAAYSLRKLRSAYTGNAIRVRRSSDNAETDIGFDGVGNLNEQALLNFVGANSAYVTTWYDQSGNGNNATQGTAANQPRIVNAGFIDKKNNSSSIVFNGTNNYLISDNLASLFTGEDKPLSLFGVVKVNYDNVLFSLGKSNSLSPLHFVRPNGDAQRRDDSNSLITLSNNFSSNNIFLHTHLFNGQNLTTINNGIVLLNNNSMNLGVLTLDRASLGAYRYSNQLGGYLNGNISELILYNSNQSTNRPSIEFNINTYYNIYGSGPLLLDKFPGAAAAYSLRKLNSSYSGSAIRVRRSSDNTEQDIGFSASGDLNESALTTFVGANSGYVTKWYDQSGLGYDAVQATAANQPRIVNAGVVDKQNSKASAYFDGTKYLKTASRVISNSNFSAFAIASGAAQNNKSLIAQHDGSSSSGITKFINSSSVSPYDKNMMFFNNGTSYISTSDTVAFDSTLKLLYSQSNVSGTSNVSVNGSSLQGTVSGQTWTPLNTSLSIGALGDGTSQFTGYISAAVLYPYNVSIPRALIENEYNSYYSLYNQSPYLLDNYTGAAAAYSVRKLRYGYTGPCMRVRRSSDNAEQDIGFDINGNLDETTLLAFCGSGSGFITTWYDQSGLARNATQSTSANQPRIVNVGVVDKINNKPAIYYDGVNDGFVLTGISYTNYFASFGVTKRYLSGFPMVLFSNYTNINAYAYIQLDNNRLYIHTNSTFAYSDFDTTNNQYLISSLNNNGTPNLYRNSSSISLTTSSDLLNIEFNSLGYRSINYTFGYIQEAVLYTSNQSTNRTGIEANINSAYSIY